MSRRPRHVDIEDSIFAETINELQTEWTRMGASPESFASREGDVEELTPQHGGVAAADDSRSQQDRSSAPREPKRPEDLALRKTKFMTYINSPYIKVDPVVIADVAPYLPENSELRFVNFNEGKDLLVVVSAKNLSTKFVDDTALHFTTEISNIATIYDSAVDDHAVFIQTKTPQRYSHRDFELRFIDFESRADREYFIANLYDASGETIEIVSWSSHLRSAGDARKKLARKLASETAQKKKDEAAEDLIETDEHDYLDVHSREKLCAKLIKEGDRKVLFACEAKTAEHKHDIMVLTTGALYIAKAKMYKKGEVRHRVVYSAIEGLVLDNAKRELCLLQIDVSQTTSLRQDVFITFPNDRLRDTFVRVFSKIYEEVIVDRLDVKVKDCAMAKRWLIESQLMRIVKLFQRNRKEEETTEEMKQSAKWTLYLFTSHVHGVVATLSAGTIGHDEGELGFVGRAIVALCTSTSTVPELLRACVEYEVLGNCGPGALASLSLASVNKSPFHETNLPNIVLESYLSGTCEAYVQVLLSQVMEEFALDPRTAEEDLVEDDLWYYTSAFLKAVFSTAPRTGDIAPQQLLMVLSLINDVCIRAERAASNRGLSSHATLDVFQVLGSFLFIKLFEPALLQPRECGLIMQEMSEKQYENVEKILMILRAVMTFTTPYDEPGVEWFASTQYGAMKDFLKSLIFSDMALWARSEEAFAKKTSFREIEQHVTTLDLDMSNVKLLLAVHRILGNRAGMYLGSSWYHAVRSGMGGSSAPADPASAAASAAAAAARRRAKSVLDDSDDEIDFAPPPPPEETEHHSGQGSPTSAAPPSDGMHSPSGAQPARHHTVRVSADGGKLHDKIAKLEAEMEDLRGYSARCGEALAAASRDALFFKEQAAGYRRALFRHRGIPMLHPSLTGEQFDTKTRMKEEIGNEIDQQVRQEARSSLRSQGLEWDDRSSDSEGSDDGNMTMTGLDGTTNFGRTLDREFSMASSMRRRASRGSDSHVVYSDFSGADMGPVVVPPRRPFGCPLDTYILTVPPKDLPLTSPKEDNLSVSNTFGSLRRFHSGPES